MNLDLHDGPVGRHFFFGTVLAPNPRHVTHKSGIPNTRKFLHPELKRSRASAARHDVMFSALTSMLTPPDTSDRGRSLSDTLAALDLDPAAVPSKASTVATTVDTLHHLAECGFIDQKEMDSLSQLDMFDCNEKTPTPSPTHVHLAELVCEPAFRAAVEKVDLDAPIKWGRPYSTPPASRPCAIPDLVRWEASDVKREAASSTIFQRLSPIPSSPVSSGKSGSSPPSAGDDESCDECLQRFGIARRKLDCRMCGEGYCADCTQSQRASSGICDRCVLRRPVRRSSAEWRGWN